MASTIPAPMRRVWLGGVGMAAAVAAAAPSHAETLSMAGTFPAAYPEAAMVHALAVERFSGRDGPALALAIERALADARVGGDYYFEVIAPGRRGNRRAEATLEGAVSSGVEENRFTRDDTRCVERKDKKCVKEEKYKRKCTRRVVNLSVDLRMARSDGRIVYSTVKPTRDELSWCEGETPGRTVEETVAARIDEIANAVRYDLAPVTREYSVRVRESTKGLPKPLAARFKAATKLSVRDVRGACAEWAAIGQAAPDHASVAFNLALCAEAAGDYPRALSLYRRAEPLLGRDSMGTEGRRRVEQLLAARDDLTERERN